MDDFDRAARDLVADHVLRAMLPPRDSTHTTADGAVPIRVIDSGTFTHYDVETNEDGVTSVVERHDPIGFWTDTGYSE